MSVECWTCRLAGRCCDEVVQQRESFFAWCRKELAPSCPDYDPCYHHGIEGVLAYPSPRPSRRRGFASIDLRRSSC